MDMPILSPITHSLYTNNHAEKKWNKKYKLDTSKNGYNNKLESIIQK